MMTIVDLSGEWVVVVWPTARAWRVAACVKMHQQLGIDTRFCIGSAPVSVYLGLSVLAVRDAAVGIASNVWINRVEGNTNP